MTLRKIFTLYTACFLGVTVLLGIAESAFGLSQRWIGWLFMGLSLGIYIVIVVEMAQVTPPVGFNLFVLQSLTRRDIGFVSRVAFPFFLMLLLFVVVIYLFPGIVTWLPGRMARG